MTKFSFCAALAAIVVCGVLVSIGPAQQGNGGYGYRPNPQQQPVQTQPRAMVSQPTIPVGLLDVGKVLENSSRIKARQEALRADMKKADNELIRERETILKLQAQLREIRSGHPEYKQREADIAKRGSDLQVKHKLMQKEFSERQAQLLYDAYKEIEQEVQAVAARRGFVMVMKYNGRDVPHDHLEAVFAYTSKPVVWFNQGLDITDEVLASLERRSGYNNPSISRNRPSIPTQPRR